MPIPRIPLRVGEVLPATVKRKITQNRVLISLKGHVLVAEPEYAVSPGDEIQVRVLTIFPRIRLRLLPSPPTQQTPNTYPMDLQT